MKSSYTGMEYTYSIINEPELNRFVIVVYIKPKDILKINQTEIGRVFITDAEMAQIQSENQQYDFVSAHVDALVKVYEDSREDNKIEEQTKNIHLVESDGTPTPDVIQKALKQLAAKEINAELSGYMNALGFALQSIHTDAAQIIIKKAAELKKAQMDGAPNQKALALQLDAMKQSFKETAVAYKQEQSKPKHTPYKPVVVQASSIDEDWYDGLEDTWQEEEEPVQHHTKKSVPKKRSAPVSLAFADSERKFRD